MRTTVHTDPQAPSYWSQYNRIHGKLGQMRGPGVERERLVRQSYNIFTGKFQSSLTAKVKKILQTTQIISTQFKFLIYSTYTYLIQQLSTCTLQHVLYCIIGSIRHAYLQSKGLIFIQFAQHNMWKVSRLVPSESCQMALLDQFNFIIRSVKGLDLKLLAC